MTYRVLHIVPNTCYVSGITKVIMNYYKLIDKTKYQFDFLYMDEYEESVNNDISLMGGRYFCIGNIIHYSSFKRNLDQFCKEHVNEYSVVHLHMPFLAIFFYKLKKKLNAKAFVLHAHSTRFGNNFLSNTRNWLFYKLFHNKADSYFACSEKAGIALFKNDYKNNGFFMLDVCSPHDTESIAKNDSKKELGLDNNIVIGHVGVFCPPKNHLFIVDVFNEYLKIQPNAKLLLVGDGPLRKKVQDYVSMKNLNNYVIFTGAQYDVDKFYPAMDAFLFPSIFEGFAMALVEAQSFGIPCLTSDIIVKEVNFNTKVNKMLSLNLGPKEWANNLNEIVNKPTIDEQYSSIFMIENEQRARLLEEKYFSLINENK